MRRLVTATAALAALASFGVGATGDTSQSSGAQRVATASRAPDAALFSQLKWRNIGPALTGGRTVDFAVVESDTDVVYAATATGGVWKTTNAAVTWEPVFEREGSASVGAVAVSQSNPGVVWVGTGEPWNARSNSWGDGVYKSENGGRTWQRMGLEKSQHVGRILIHPKDPNIVYIAALGALWGPNEERGLFKTTDGGRTWTKSLYVSPHTGVADVAMDPRDPDLLYASAFQRERRNYSFIAGGPEGALYRSSDGGKTWEKLQNGLPKGDIGRIGMSICRSQPDTVYAVVDGQPADFGIYRSDDRGASWERVNRQITGSWGAGQIRCDPNDPQRVYVLRNGEAISIDGGRTFKDALAVPGVHVDLHAFWIDPADSDHMILGNDGGIYFSYDRGRTWDFVSHLSLAQFYTVAVDMQEPFYYVYGGTQDNNSFGGPSGTRNSDGVTNADWYMTTGGDGFHVQIDPTDPTIVYTESQYGRLVRFDTRTGERRLIQPRQPRESEGPKHRYNWSAPVLLSKFEPKTVYFAANVLFKSTDRGDTWKTISPDVTRQLDQYTLPLMGKVWPRGSIGLHVATADYGQISTLAESPLKAGVLAVGTDDGVIQVTRDDGAAWTRIEKFGGVPERTYVSRVALSAFDDRLIYATFDGHQDNNFKPYVYKSADFGKTWTSITGNLPDFGSTRVIVEHPRNRNLLFVGTEMGVFVSTTGGDTWVSLKNNLPTVPVHDMVIHPRENDLVLGTHGRGFWILDDLSIFETLTPETAGTDLHLAKLRPAMQMHRFDRGRRFLGQRTFNGQNPPDGAIITYYLNPRAAGSSGATPSSGAESGGQADGNGDVTEPAQASAAAAPGAPRVEIDILDAAGAFVRRLDPPQGDKGTGVQRVVWDLRHPLAFLPEASETESFFTGRLRGPFVVPGEYTVRLRVGSTEQTQTVRVKSDPIITLSEADRRTWRDTLQRVNRMQAVVRAVTATATEIEQQLKNVNAALARMPSTPATLKTESAGITRELEEVFKAIRGDGGRTAAEQAGPLPLRQDIDQLYANIEAFTGLPTADQRWLIDHCQRELDGVAAKVNRLARETLPQLHRHLDEAGVAWTPGRAIAPPK